MTQQNDAKPSEMAEREVLLAGSPRRRGKARRVMLVLGGTLLLMLGAGAAFAPAIASKLAPGIIEREAGKAISGSASVQGVELSWGGPQVVRGASLRTPDGAQVVLASVTVEAGLWGLVRGNLDLGEVTISDATLNIVRNADGTTNLDKAISPRAGKTAPPSSGGAKSGPTLPRGLRVNLGVKNLDATFTDHAVGPTPLVVTIDDLIASGTIAPGEPLNFTLGFFASQGAGSTGRGELKLVTKVQNWSTTDGAITPTKATGTIGLSATSLPVAIADALGIVKGPDGAPISLSKALGGTLDLKLDANGDSAGAVITIDAALANAGLKGKVAYAGNAIEATEPLAITITGPALRALLPQMESAFDPKAPAHLESFPNAAITVDTLRLPIANSGPLDLRGGKATLRLELGQISGRVAMDAGQPARPFVVAPLTARVESADFAQGVRITADSRATIGGSPAGEIHADVSASQLLSAAGAPGAPGAVNGVVRISGVATAIAQPFVASAGLDLPKDLGPTLDLELKADTATGPGAAGVTNIDALVKSDRLTVNGSLEVSAGALKTRGDGIVVESSSLGDLASRFVPASSGWAVASPAGGGRGVVRVRGVTMPRDAGGAFRADQGTGVVTVELRELLVRAMDEKGTPKGPDIRINGVNIWSNLTPGGNLKATLTGAGAHGQDTFDLKGDVDVKGLLRTATQGAVTKVELTPPMTLRPTGTFEVTKLPAGLIAMLAKPGSPGGTDASGLIAQSLGGPGNVKVTFAGVADQPGAVEAGVTFASPGVTAQGGGVASASQIALRRTQVAATLAPALITEALRLFAPDVASGSGAGVSLAGPAKIEVQAEPITLPLTKEGAVAFDRAGVAKAQVRLPGRTLVDGLAMRNEDGSSRPLGRIGVENLVLDASAPVAALMSTPPAQERTATATLAGAVVGADGAPLLKLDGNARADLSGGALAGSLASNIRVAQVNTAGVERLLGKEGLLTGLLGPNADADLALTIDPPAGGFGPSAPVTSGDIGASLALTSPRLVTEKPLRVRVLPDRFSLREPASVTLDADVANLNRMLRGTPAAGQEKPAFELTQLDRLTLTIERLALPRAGASESASAFTDVQFSLAAPTVGVRDSGGQMLTWKGTTLKVASEKYTPNASGVLDPLGPALTFGLNAGEVRVGDAPPATGAKMQGKVTGIFPGGNRLDVPGARLSMGATIPAMSTGVIDTLLNQRGLMNEALGPVISVVAEVHRLPLSMPGPGPDGRFARVDNPPLIQLDARSTRANAKLRGTINEGLFRSETPVEVTLTEITQGFSARMLKSLPLIGTVEKTPQDAPAVLTATNLAVPLEKELNRLNGDIRVEFGQVRFATSPGFGAILQALHQRTKGVAGARVDPLVVNIKNGVATYPRWKVPLGEFTIETEGVVNLTTGAVRVETPNGPVSLGPNELEVITWIPFGALTDQASGALNIGVGSALSRVTPGLLDALTMIPFKTRGPMNQPRTGADAELLGKNLVNKINPENLIRDGLGDLLKRRQNPGESPK